MFDEDILSRVLTKIAPFITSINSIDSRSQGIDLFEMVYNNNNTNHESQLLLKEMMAKTRILFTKWLYSTSFTKFVHDIHRYNYGSESWVDQIDWCCSWLYTPRDDGKPRMLRFCDYVNGTTEFAAFFIEHIKKANVILIKI
jgi:hypothetical protein